MIIDKRHSICHKVVYEVRYKYGFTYLDRCGSTVNEIMNRSDEWELAGVSPDPQNAPLISLRNGARFNFNTLKYDFALEQTQDADKDIEKQDLHEFIQQVDLVSSIVNERLSLNDFERVGFRIWYLFASKSREDSEKWISRLLKTNDIDDSIAVALNGDVEAKSHVVVVASQDRKFRISITGVTTQTQLDLVGGRVRIRKSTLGREQDKFLKRELKRAAKNPEFAVMFDIDSFVESPKDIDAKDFITESLKQIEEKVPKAFK
jgi:hypothetical protein